ncbi:MAG: O-antigen ligase family protein [Nostocaceae cyanobacterium]|nr:O-antigen ligase family protein [Nostocaceae cyanobacterium]
MSSIPIKPQNLPEALIWYYIIFTYPIYFLGAQFVLAPLLATFLTGYLIFKWWNQTEETPLEERIIISSSAWVWVIAVLMIEVALIVGHLNFNLGIRRIITSSLLWYRTWGLMALFPLIGHLNIRPKLIYRAVCILCLQSVLFLLIGSIIGVLGIHNIGYTSPLKVLGGSEKYYEVKILQSVTQRISLFAIWSTLLGMIANIYFFCVQQEIDKKLRWCSMIAAVIIIVLTRARAAILCLIVVSPSVWLFRNFLRPWVCFTTGFISFLIGIFSPSIIEFMTNLIEQFHKLRAGSSAVRHAIYRITLERWWNEAPIWGHGVREAQGPAFVAFMPIGSHHTWFGVLFSYGLVGFIALAFAFLWTFMDLLSQANTNENTQVGLSIILVLLINSFSQNLEFFTYLYWPGLLILGMAFKENISFPETLKKTIAKY